ncbi:MAG TPA: M23 family metallopeptidase [Geminicoccaceae bacterium]
MKLGPLSVILVTVAARAAAAAAPELGLPLACRPGEDCWPIRYVDHDPGPGERDYRCGEQTGDGHDGTDVAIRDLAAMAEGVPVLTVAPGVVRAVRDGEPDQNVVERGEAALQGRDCGNGVRIDHGEGWISQVCHLRRGSVRVLEGDRVERGDPLGLVGLSGATSFPHVHLTVEQEGRTVDPFLGGADPEDCGASAEPLWRADVLEDLTYEPVVLHAAGFAGAAPEADDLRRGWHRGTELPVTSPALVFWVDGFWVRAGDRLSFEVVRPDGSVLVDDESVIDDDHRRYFAFAGRRRPDGPWPAGRYRGRVVLERESASGEPVRTSLAREVVLR